MTFSEVFIGLLPSLSFFFLGLFFKSVKVFKKEDGVLLLKFVFYLFIPALCFYRISQVDLEVKHLFITLSPLAPILFTLLLAHIYLKFYPQPREVAGVVYCGAMNIKSSFAIPMAYAIGTTYMANSAINEGAQKVIFFDQGNLFIIFTLIYFIVVKTANRGDELPKGFVIKKLLSVPTIWAFIIAIVLNLTGLIPSYNSPAEYGPVMKFFQFAQAPAVPIIFMSLGLTFSPRLKNMSKAFSVIAMRMIGGLIAGVTLVWLAQYFLDLDTLTKKIVIIGCSVPIGFNTVVFAALENLDERFAATIVSLSILIGIVYVPMIIWVLGMVF